MSSVQLQEYTEHHAPSAFVGRERGYLFERDVAFPWPARYWQGAFVTDGGHVIRAWLDEVLMDAVRAAKGIG